MLSKPALRKTHLRRRAGRLESPRFCHHAFGAFCRNGVQHSCRKKLCWSISRGIETAINKHRFAVHFPVECRWAKADDLLLSPANGRESAYIAVHMYKGMPYKAYFETLEAIFKAHGGRPHWGKMNTCTAKDFQKMYPDWHQFLAIREKMDSNGIFMNAYFGQLIG